MKIFELPKGYKKAKEIDLEKDRKLCIGVNIFSLLIAVFVFLVGYIIYPIEISFIDKEQAFRPLLVVLIVLALMVVYAVLHELIHGVFFRIYSGKKATYGYKGVYAFAKCDAYFKKKEYLVIGLSPIVIFGVLLLVANIVLGETLFWYIYAVQIANLSGAAGDLYVSFALRRFPKDTLIKDDGVSMTLYTSSVTLEKN